VGSHSCCVEQGVLIIRMSASRQFCPSTVAVAVVECCRSVRPWQGVVPSHLSCQPVVLVCWLCTKGLLTGGSMRHPQWLC
jgi:hypothetical protein